MKLLHLNYNNRHFPILQLPPEISTDIFLTAFPENSFSSWGKATPLLLGAVCHSWRVLAWSLPQLWASLSFTVKHYYDTKNDLLEQWLARSRNLPLSIQIIMYRPQNKTKVDEPWRKVMDIIARFSERWQAIDFQLFYPLHPQVCTVPRQLPLLVSMSVCMNGFDFRRYNDYHYKPNVVWNAPKLQNIYMDSTGHCLDLRLSLNQTTTFTWMSSPCPERCLQILKDAPNLIKCQFGDLETMLTQSSNRAIALRLQTLQIGFRFITGSNSAMPILLNNLTAPTLRELSISHSMFSNYTLFSSDVLVSFLSRSACHLLRLTLSNITLLPEQLVLCLSATPSLTELRLGNMDMTSEIFKVLTLAKSSQNILLPNLERFSYINHEFSPYIFDFARLIMMVTSRWHVDPPSSASSWHTVNLKSIHINFPWTEIDCYLDTVNDREDVLEESIDAGERNDDAAEGECFKLNRRLIARFQRLIAEGMDIRILGNFTVNLLNLDTKI